MTDPRVEVVPPSGRRSRRGTFVVAWAGVLTVLLGLTFAGTTVATIALWSTEADYEHTNPVVDLAFFALGGILITVGVASQVRGGHVAGLQQAVLALLAFSVAGAWGGRVEPLGGARLVADAGMAVAGVVRWRRRARPRGGLAGVPG